MKSINFQEYREIVVNDILSYSISQLQNKYKYDIKYLYSILNDLSHGSGSPNYKLINKIARQENIPVEFLVNTAYRLIADINYDSSTNYYEILNLEQSSSTEEIRESWLNLVKKNHPDLIGDEGVEKTKELNEAYEVLRDTNKRNDYDLGFFDYYPIFIEHNNYYRFFSRKYLMLYSVVLILAISFLLKGYFESFINDNKGKGVADRQLEYFEEVNKEKSQLKYNKDVEDLYSEFNNGKDTSNRNNSSVKNKELELSVENSILISDKKDEKKQKSENNHLSSGIKDKVESDEKKSIYSDTKTNIAKNNIETASKKQNNTKDVVISMNSVKKNKKDETDELLNSLIKKYGSKLKDKNKDKKSIDNNESAILNTKSTKKPGIDMKVPVKKDKISKIKSEKKTPIQSDKDEKKEIKEISKVDIKNNQPSSTSLYYFVSDYVSAYKNRDYKMMKNLFMPDASENDMDINHALEMYKTNFNKHKIIRYDIQIKNKSVKGKNGIIDGNFVVIYKNNDNEEVNTKEGSISWKLKWIKENWKISSLNYKFRDKDEYL